MFKLFKKEVLSSTKMKIYDKVIIKNKSINDIIDEIHESFYTEVNKLLEEAKISKSLETTKQDLINKAIKLKELGFSNTRECNEANIEINRLNILETENKNKEVLIKAINYFSFKYPNYKFITEKSVKKICKKYNLIYTTIDKYISVVPDKNLQQISDFKIKEEDDCYIFGERYGSTYLKELKYISKSDFDIELELKKSRANRVGKDWRIVEILEKCSMEIAASIKDFNTKNMEVKDFKLSKIEIPDPVVLYPVFFEGTKHFLIVTAWGKRF